MATLGPHRELKPGETIFGGGVGSCVPLRRPTVSDSPTPSAKQPVVSGPLSPEEMQQTFETLRPEIREQFGGSLEPESTEEP